ncbi:17998_t:CDS:2, partial [Acaulospora morrowiae]
MTEVHTLQVKSGKTTNSLTFKNDVLSLGKRIDVPSRNILDVTLKTSSPESTNVHVEIRALIPSKNNKLRLYCPSYEVVEPTSATPWVEFVKNVAYKKAKPCKRLMVFINPFGGTGKAKRIFDRDVKPIFDAAGCTYDIIVTAHKDDAKEKITEAPELEKYDVIVA